VVITGSTFSGNTAANNNAIQFWNGATINNRGVFNDANAFASFIEHNVGGPHNFVNLGTYNKLNLGVTGFLGRSLDRFSRFELGDYRSASVRGFNGSGIHFDRGAVAVPRL